MTEDYDPKETAIALMPYGQAMYTLVDNLAKANGIKISRVRVLLLAIELLNKHIKDGNDLDEVTDKLSKGLSIV